MVEIFQEGGSVLKQENCFVDFLRYVISCKHTAKFCHSVRPVFWYSYLSYLHDMTDGPMVFQEVDRPIKLIKF